MIVFIFLEIPAHGQQYSPPIFTKQHISVNRDIRTYPIIGSSAYKPDNQIPINTDTTTSDHPSKFVSKETASPLYSFTSFENYNTKDVAPSTGNADRGSTRTYDKKESIELSDGAQDNVPNQEIKFNPQPTTILYNDGRPTSVHRSFGRPTSVHRSFNNLAFIREPSTVFLLPIPSNNSGSKTFDPVLSGYGRSSSTQSENKSDYSNQKRQIKVVLDRKGNKLPPRFRDENLSSGKLPALSPYRRAATQLPTSAVRGSINFNQNGFSRTFHKVGKASFSEIPEHSTDKTNFFPLPSRLDQRGSHGSTKPDSKIQSQEDENYFRRDFASQIIEIMAPESRDTLITRVNNSNLQPLSQLVNPRDSPSTPPEKADTYLNIQQQNSESIEREPVFTYRIVYLPYDVVNNLLKNAGYN
ncbi:uncharacterized protein LOC143254288 isoform X2 [Tachypleus tridentatus]